MSFIGIFLIIDSCQVKCLFINYLLFIRTSMIAVCRTVIVMHVKIGNAIRYTMLFN